MKRTRLDVFLDFICEGAPAWLAGTLPARLLRRVLGAVWAFLFDTVPGAISKQLARVPLLGRAWGLLDEDARQATSFVGMVFAVGALAVYSLFAYSAWSARQEARALEGRQRVVAAKHYIFQGRFELVTERGDHISVSTEHPFGEGTLYKFFWGRGGRVPFDIDCRFTGEPAVAGKGYQNGNYLDISLAPPDEQPADAARADRSSARWGTD